MEYSHILSPFHVLARLFVWILGELQFFGCQIDNPLGEDLLGKNVSTGKLLTITPLSITTPEDSIILCTSTSEEWRELKR